MANRQKEKIMADKYLKNPLGAVHSVTEEHFAALLEKGDDNIDYLPHGWTELKEAEARKANPQLFGTPDPRVLKNAAELKEEAAIEEYRAQQLANQQAQA
jgi:hypothetical protein